MDAKNANKLPADDLVELEVAFDMLGRHRFGAAWPENMAERVRLGRGISGRDELDTMARWALGALMQSVQNGWLPLIYFVGERRTRRVVYYDEPDGPALVALYPNPAMEAGGQIELADGAIYPCRVNVRGFAALLAERFGQRARRGPKSNFEEFRAALDYFYLENPPSASAAETINSLRKWFTGAWPKKTALYDHIRDAQLRAIERLRSRDN